MTCRSCAEKGLDHDLIVQRSRRSLFWFSRWFVSDWTSEELHRPICDAYQDAWDEGWQHFLIMIPRRHLKTTILTVAQAVRWLVVNPDLRIAIFMSSERMAAQKLTRIKAVLMSSRFRHFFGHLVPRELGKVRWNKTEVEIVHPGPGMEEPSITALGLDSKIIGSHWDYIIADDLVGREARKSPVLMANAVEFLSHVEGFWVDGTAQRLVVPGTAWPGGEDGYYERQLKDDQCWKLVLGAEVDDRWRALLRSRGIPTDNLVDGMPVSPRETLASLARARSRFGGDYVYQMLNLIDAPQDRTFNLEDCLRFAWKAESARA